MSFEIFLNIVIIALLTIGIVYAILLEHRLSCAKENSRQLALLIDQFYKASHKISEELVQLKNMADTSRCALKTDLERAALIRDELNFLLNKIKKTLPFSDDSIQSIREPLQEEIVSKPLSQAEKELIAALDALK